MRHGEVRKRGDATGRPGWKSSLLAAPEAEFFCRKAAWSENRPAPQSGRPLAEFALRCALNAPPFGLRRASLRANSTNNQTAKPKKGHFYLGKKGDISILL